MSHHTALHRLVRPAVRVLAKTPIRPNHVTALRIVMALAAMPCIATGTPRAVALGAGLFMMSAVLDRVDGELARLTGRLSRMGHRLDLVADCGGDALLFMAMGLGARHGGLGWGAFVLGLGAAVGVGLMFWHFNAADEPQGAPVVRHFDPDDTMLAVPLAAVLVGLSPIVLIAGIAAPFAASVLIVRAARARREAAPRPGAVQRTPARL